MTSPHPRPTTRTGHGRNIQKLRRIAIVCLRRISAQLRIKSFIDQVKISILLRKDDDAITRRRSIRKSTSIIHKYAWVAGSLVLGGCWVLGAWLSDGWDGWDTSIRHNERSFVFLSGAVRRFPPSSLYEYWCHIPPWAVLFCLHLFERIRPTAVLLVFVVFPSTGAVCRLG